MTFSDLTLVVLLNIAAQVATPTLPATPTVQERLAAYEANAAASGRANPQALAAIARDVVIAARQSGTFRVWSEACAITSVPDGERCGPRLWAVLNNASVTPATRAEAASALIVRGDGDKDAVDKLFQLLMAVPLNALASFAPIAATMPSGRAVPVLTRLVESASKTDQAIACKTLSGVDSGESRTAIARVLGANAPGSEPWLLCMVARARLRDAVPPAALWGYGHTLQGDGLLFAARVMVETNNEASAQTLTDLTRRGPMADRLAAADLLAGLKPEIAAPVIEQAEADHDPAVRAAALDAERGLKRPPPKNVRGMLADPSLLVAIRAAENAIEWAQHEQNR